MAGVFGFALVSHLNCLTSDLYKDGDRDDDDDCGGDKIW